MADKSSFNLFLSEPYFEQAEVSYSVNLIDKWSSSLYPFNFSISDYAGSLNKISS